MMPRRNALGVAQVPPPPPAAPPEEKLDYIAQQLQRLVEIGEQLIGQVPIVLEPKIVPGLVSVPLEPRVLNHAIQAMDLHGKSFFPVTKATWVCPAGVTTVMPFTNPNGFIATCTDYTLSSDFYDPNITVNILVDDVNTTPFGIALTGLTPMEYAEYHVKHKEVLVEVINNTAFNAQISFQVFACFIEKSFYEEFYRPIIEYMHSALEGVARG